MLPAAFFKCLSDETRIRVLLMLCAEAELCVCELIWALGEPQSKVSRHLAQLRSANVLADRRQGQWVFYRLHPELPEWARAVLQTTYAANQAWLSADLVRLAALTDRPDRQAACC